MVQCLLTKLRWKADIMWGISSCLPLELGHKGFYGSCVLEATPLPPLTICFPRLPRLRGLLQD